MQPGEWYLDTAESSGPNDNMTLYLWPNTTNGLPPRTLIAPHLASLRSYLPTACLCCRALHTGLLEKQGCFYFQALSALATVERNIAFNGPRAAVNFSTCAITATQT
jgi:hypothetical protein